MRRSIAAASAFVASIAAPSAAPVTQPGEQVGLAAGFPLPEGIYAIDTLNLGRSDFSGAPDVGVNIPLIIWSSPYKIFGAHIEPVLAVPSAFVSPNNPVPIRNRNVSIFFNPFIGSTFAWNLGGGLGVSYLFGAYLPVGDRGSFGLGLSGTPLLPQTASTTLRQSFFTTFVGDGSYNLTAAFTYNLTLDPTARYGGPVGAALGSIPNADSINLDLTATKKFGAFEIGPVAYAYTDLPVNRDKPLYARYQSQGYIAVGGLIGYNFGTFAVQVYVTRLVVARETLGARGLQQRNEETRGWLRIAVPFPNGGSGAASFKPIQRYQ